MLPDRWICDRTPTERFPDYTRGNAGEVLADPVSPLAWTFCWEPGPVMGCVDGFEQMGVFDALEYGTPPESFGLFGGYFYNSLTQARLFGVRSGAGWQAIDAAYFDASSQAIPPYREADWHASERHTAKLQGTVGWCLTTPMLPEVELQKHEAKAIRDSRPDFSTLSDAQILARARVLQRHLRVMFQPVVWCSLGSSVGVGIIPAITGEADPEAMSKLMTGIGGVDSADIAGRIFIMSRMVRRSAELTAAFDGDLTGIFERLRADGSPAAAELMAAVDAFLYEHGSRGPNEWDIYQPCYETKPLLLAQAIERVRTAGDEADPEVLQAAGAAERARVIADWQTRLAGDPETLGTFMAAVNSLAVFMAARERCKCNNIRAHGEVRQCFDELGRRMVERGHLASDRLVYMLLADELDAFLVDPASLAATLAERQEQYLALYELEPPYTVDGVAPPLSQWERRDSVQVATVQVGDLLQGVAGSPGTVSGTARVMLDLSDPSCLEPGDIMIAPSTDPSWTPLFLTVGAVITNIGAVGTHAVIVSRELGIPCVPSIPDATRRIPDGATITVNGTLGTVTIDALP